MGALRSAWTIAAIGPLLAWMGPGCGGGGGGGPSADVLLLPGVLDPAFGSNGSFTVNLPYEEVVTGVAVQPDGKIVVVGTAPRSATNSDMFVARLNDDGSYDSTFNTIGYRYVDLGGVDECFGVALRASDGAIVVVGRTDTVGAGAVAVAVVTASGDLDTLFNGLGREAIDLSTFADEGRAVFVLPDDNILVAGTYAVSSTSNMFVARLTPTGALDPSFHGGTITTVTFLNKEEGLALAVDPILGNIVVAGYTDFTTPVGHTDMAVARLLPNGYPDDSFGGDAKVQLDFGFDEVATGVQVDLLGRVLLTGNLTATAVIPEVAVARLTPTGDLDATYHDVAVPSGSDGDGRITFPYAATEACAASLLDPEGRLVVVGRTNLGGAPTANVLLSRIESYGELDNTFAGGGTASLQFGGDDEATAVARDTLGRLVLVGTRKIGGVPNLLVMRCGGGSAVDQRMDSWSALDISAGVHTDFDRAQSFTVGRTGVLARIDLYVSRSYSPPPANDVELTIRPMLGGVPDPDGASALATKTLTSAAWPDTGWISVDLSVPVTAGTVLAVVLRELNGAVGPVMIGSSDGNDYPLGETFYFDHMTGGGFLASAGDYAFRTYVR